MAPWAAGSHILRSSLTFIESTKVFRGLTTTERPSKATGASTNLIDAAPQASISAARIGREASEMSVSLAQNFLKPPPVPEIPTVTRTLPPVAFWNSSAMASEMGNTVDEPSTLIVPESVRRSAPAWPPSAAGPAPCGAAPHAASVAAPSAEPRPASQVRRVSAGPQSSSI